MTEGEKHREALEQQELKHLAKHALRSAERRETLGDRFREHVERTPLEYRTEYHRDRDRILWSSAFRRLQHKTQIFPHYVEDHYRRRLTHSLEVSQIATTLSRALHLNEAATEAMALGHDIGHTPFGHGGEESLNSLLRDRLPRASQKQAARLAGNRPDYQTPVLLFGFDHCVQGIEQVCRITAEYLPGYSGLNLSFDIRDGILKHIYDNSPKEAEKAGRPFSSLRNIVRLKAYRQYKYNCGSLEAQCVWLADKVGYLLGDLEDALRAFIFRFRDIVDTKLVRTIWAKHNSLRGLTKKLQLRTVHDFMEFKRAALTVLILDCIEATKKRIGDLGPKSVEDVLSHPKRVVDVSGEVREAWDEFYNEVVREKLFRHENVQACAFKARVIMKDLFDAYRATPDLIPQDFRRQTEKAYDGLLPVKHMDPMKVRNYLAGMTDSFAIEQHKRLYMSSERAGRL